MSFAKAKRFNYKQPDIPVSPADYYISTSLQKSCTISKGPRFPTKHTKDLRSSNCSRFNCRCNKFRENNSGDISRSSRASLISLAHQSSTPQCKNKNGVYLDNIKQKIINLNRKGNQRSSFRNKSVKRIENRNNVKDLVNKYENLPSGSNFWTSEEFIDDDYHSYTSSDDLDHIHKVNLYGLQNLTKDSDRSIFENIILEKMERIKNNIEKFQKNLADLHEKVHDKKTDNKNESGLERYIKHFGSRISLAYDQPDDLKQIVYQSIYKLRKEFEGKQRIIISEALDKIRNVAKDLYIANKQSANHLKKISDNTAFELYKEVMYYIEKNDTLEYDTSDSYADMLEETEKTNTENHNCFNYENICQVLSNHLQDSQKELENLKRDKMNISLKCGNTQEKLMAQTSIIDMLHEEIEELKRTC